MHYGRKERRALARSLGMIGQTESPTQWRARIRRSQEAGRQIHRQFVNNCESNLRNAAADTEARILASYTASHGEERANEIVTNNRKIAESRSERLAERFAKQKAKAK